MSDWIKTEDKLPDVKSDIFKIKRENSDILNAYFYKDQMNWAKFYGHKTSYWYNASGDREPLFDVKEWQCKTA